MLQLCTVKKKKKKKIGNVIVTLRVPAIIRHIDPMWRHWAVLSALKGCFLSHGGAHCWSFSHQPLWPRQRKRGLMITLKKEKKKWMHSDGWAGLEKRRRRPLGYCKGRNRFTVCMALLCCWGRGNLEWIVGDTKTSHLLFLNVYTRAKLHYRFNAKSC